MSPTSPEPPSTSAVTTTPSPTSSFSRRIPGLSYEVKPTYSPAFTSITRQRTGILVKLAGLSQTRIDNCYLDYNSIIMEDPVQVHITNGFFLGDGNVVVKSVNGRISGLNILNNMFSGDPKKSKQIVELNGEFKEIDQVVVENNNVLGMGLRSTAAKVSVTTSENVGSTKWVADFSGMLLFPNRISHFQYSIYSKGGVFNGGHAVTNVTNNVVVVETEKPLVGVVSVEVDQYNVVGEGFS